jgi:hypothetical protein
LERYFAEELENAVAPILEAWRQAKALPSHDQIETMAAFLAHMHLRTRRALENLILFALADLAVGLERAIVAARTH